MEEILEIRDGCKTPLQLLKSKAFTRYLSIYKKQFIKELKSREDSEQKEEVVHKIEFIEDIDRLAFIEIFESDESLSSSDLAKHKEVIRFLEGLFHHYRKKSYTRLIKLHDNILNSKESAESIKDRISNRANKLTDLILETRRILVAF